MSRYAESHVKTAGPSDARPTALQIIKDEGLEGALQDRVFLATGCSSGIGIESRRAIAATGGKVFLAVRDLEKGRSACESFLESCRVELLEFHSSKLDSVKSCARNNLVACLFRSIPRESSLNRSHEFYNMPDLIASITKHIWKVSFWVLGQ